MRGSRVVLATLLLAAMVAPTAAQQSPYVDFQERDIKALSPETIEEYRSGQGMGFALAAELNGYPGPKHALELSEELELTDEQRKVVQRSFSAMHGEAVELGNQLIELEAEVDQLFASNDAQAEDLREILDELGQVRAALRFAHLSAHLETRQVLTLHQVHQYSELRGYSDGGHHQHHSPDH